MNITESIGGAVSIFYHIIDQNLSLHVIQVWILTAPESRFVYKNILLHLCCSIRLYVHAGAYRCGNCFPFRIQNCGTHHCVCSGTAVILYGRLHFNGYIAVLLFLQIRSSHIGTIFLHMYRICHHKLNIAVNTGTGIPAAGWIRADYFDCDHILCTAVAGHIIGNVKCKIIVTIMVFAKFLAVYIHIGMVVNTVKIQYQCLSRIFSRQNHTLAVPSGSARQKSGLCLILVRVLLINTEVVGKLLFLPCGIVKGNLLRSLLIAEQEFPVLVKIHFSVFCCLHYCCGTCTHHNLICRRCTYRQPQTADCHRCSYEY